MCLQSWDGNFQTYIKVRYLEHFMWNCSHVIATRPHWWLVSIGSGNGLVPSGTKAKPLPELMPIQICVAISLQWHHNECNGVSNHQSHKCLLNHLFRRRSKKTSQLHVTGLCAGNSPVTDEFPTQRASNTENVSIWWHHPGHQYSLSQLFSTVHHQFFFQSVVSKNSSISILSGDSSCSNLCNITIILTPEDSTNYKLIPMWSADCFSTSSIIDQTCTLLCWHGVNENFEIPPVL